MWAARLAGSLGDAVAYVVGGAGAAAAALPAGQPQLVSDGRIDFDAVAQHVGRAVAAAAASGVPTLTGEQQQESQPPSPGGEQAGGDEGAEASLAAASAALAEADAAPGDAGLAVADGPPPLVPAEEAGSGSRDDEPPELAGSPDEPGSPDGAAAAAAAAPAPPPPPPHAGSGRLGPEAVTLVEARGTAEINGCCALSRTNFATVRSSVCVYRGRWMYECQLGSAGIMQLGWTTLNARFNSEEGVGDTHDSFAYDGRRRFRWNVSNHAYGEFWAAGDVIGCCIDLDAGTMRFHRNGRDLGEAFSNVRRGMPGAAYFAGVSLSFSERCEVNFGGRPFVHPVEGYQPLQGYQPWEQQAQQAQQAQQQQGVEEAPLAAGAPTQQGQLAAARYLTGCLSRLIDVSSPLPAAGSGAAGGAAAAGELAEGSEGAQLAQQLLAFPPPAHHGPGLLSDADMLAALAAAGEAGSSKAAAPLELSAAAHGGGPAGPAIRADERALLGAVLAEHLGPLCFESYAVEAVLVPLLDDVAGELSGGPRRRAALLCSASAPGSDSSDEAASGAADVAAGGPSGLDSEDEAEQEQAEEEDEEAAGGGQQRAAGAPAGEPQELGRRRLGELLSLLAAVLEPEELSALATTCCQVLARCVRGCVCSAADQPASEALSGLRLWSAVLDCPPFLEAWLASGDWEGQLEHLLTVHQPSEDDLSVLLRNLKVTWGEGDTVVSNRSEDQSAFTEDLSKIAEVIEQVEAAHADLLLQLWLAGGGSAQRRESPAAAGGEEQVPAAGEQQQQQQQPAAASAEEEQPAGTSEDLQQQAAAAEQQQQPSAGQQQAAAAAPPARQLPPLAPSRQQPPAAQQPHSQQQQEQQQQQGEDQEQGRHLRLFLSYLINKNHGAMRHVPPPGLSDQTALVSAVFALLRLMNEQVAAALPEVPMLRWDPAATFLQGGPLGGGDDPYWDAGRMGGTVSHLVREHPITEDDRRPLLPLPVGALVKYDVPLRLAGRAAEGPSFADASLRDRLLMLCHLSAAPLMRGGLRHLASMQAAMQGMRALGGEAGGRLAADTRRQYQQEFQRSLRAHEWVQCWLLSPWRQQAAFVLSVSTAQLLEAVSEQRGELLRYVPEFYVSTCLDMVHAVHRCEPAALDHSAMLGLGLRHIVHLVVSHLEDPRIVSPEVQSRLLSMVLDGVQELDLLRELGDNEVSRARLLPAMMRLFGRPQLWGHVYSFFALLVEGSGFLHPPAAFPPEFTEPLGKLRALFRATCLSDRDLCTRFTHHLFDSANRMLTELVSSLESMETSWTRGAGPSPQLLRLLSSTADYSLVLLRVMEMMAVEMPELFLEGSAMNLTRLAEVFGFAVPQLLTGRAHRALQRVAAARLAQQLRLREAHLLQPLAGALVALWQAETRSAVEQAASGGSEAAPAAEQLAPAAPEARQEAQPAAEAAAQPAGQSLAAEQPPAVQPRHRQSLLRALDRQAALTDGVLQGLLEIDLTGVQPLSGEVHAGDEHAPSPEEQHRAEEAQVEQLRQAVGWVLQHREAVAAAAVARAAGGGVAARRVSSLNADELAEAPEEFLDPILATLMQDPVALPDSKVVLDRATIERHLLSSQTDPFSRAPLHKEQLLPDTQLRGRIEAWLAEHHPGGGHHLS